MSSKVSCFVAYPSKPPSLAETIEGFISKIKQGKVVAIDGWKSTSVAGKFIITSICEAIQEKDIFICDLTNLNQNVLFELGYAIAKKKRIWILLDPNIEKSKLDYEKFKLLTTVGCSSYSNSYEIEKAFYKEQPYEDIESTIHKDAIESVIKKTREKFTLLYLKSGIDTEASVKLSRIVNKSSIPNIVDDPNEVRIQTLSWYAQEVYNAYAVIAHFLSPTHTGWRYHNAKNSFVSGLAFGFGKHLLMLAHEPYESPIDYRDLLKTHKTGALCENIANSWLNEIESTYLEKVVETRKYVEKLRAHAELENISIGETVAEQESDDLLNYFIPTSAYTKTLSSKHSIFVGRKGAGKTAILYKLGDELGSDVRNHVCIIKPIAYELEGILRMLKQAIPKSEKGYLIESFWKFLIYTELAKSIFKTLESKPSYYQRDDNEEEFFSFVEKNSSIITQDFSIRLESVVESLQDVNTLRTAELQRTRISELLHDKVIEKLRTMFGKVLQNKNKVTILIDNLDKAWKLREDLSMLSELLFGLLGVSRRISRDFEKSGYWRQPINLSLIIFLRSDIFSQVIRYARERDKISYSRLIWDDHELLLRVIEERFINFSPAITRPSEVWARYFCEFVNGIPTREYLTKYILPRPRDLIYLCKAAIAQAVNLRHTKVEEEDILEAHKKYSQYALDSLIVENGIQIEALESLLYEFVSAEEVITRDKILQAMKDCKIPEGKVGDVIELLCDLTFLAREVEFDRFEFLYNDEDKVKLQVMARKTVEARAGKVERFCINKAFHSYLEIVPVYSNEGSIYRK